MTTTTQKLTLAEYLAYDDGTGAKYELVNGDLVYTALGTGEHGDISEFLNEAFKDEIKRASCFQGDDLIISPTFADLTLTAAQVLRAKRCG